MSEEISKLRESIHKMIQENTPVLTIWCSVKSVDWDSKTMVATGTTDKLDYNDVLLGLDSVCKKPKIGTKCLIGIIENKDAQSFLISCDEVDAIEFQTTGAAMKWKVEDDTWTWNDGENEGIVKVLELTSDLNKIQQDLNALKTVFSSAWAVVPSDGGAALKAAAATWAGQTLELSNKDNLQNNKIRH
ncbi:MAG: hypothetical protein U0T77_10770 [Chitinophagales bacterium]